MIKQINLVLEKLANRDLYPVFAGELEFYILGKDLKTKNWLSKISKITNLQVQKEKGHRQYEIASTIYNNVFSFINFINETRKNLLALNNEYSQISFKPKPYRNDYGSAMHIHLSIQDSNKVNLFNYFESIEKNTLLINSINGILTLLNESLYMLTGDDTEEFARFEKGYMCPTNISWGKNNRTTAIRVPDSLPYSRNRRIEFRVPSAQSCIYSNILFLLTAILYGIENNFQSIQCTYGNASDAIYNNIKLHSNLKDAKNNFHFYEYFNRLCGG